MLNSYLKYLISECKKFAKEHDVFDIILFGSASKGKTDARDIDIILLFNEKPLKERIEIAQKLKEILKKKISNLDIKTANLKELFEEEFLARQSILTEGFSLIHNTPFSKTLGFEGYALFSYNLKNLNHNEKTKFTYALIGRNSAGVLKNLKAVPLGKGAVMIPIKDSLNFERFLNEWKINYIKKSILVSAI